MTDRTAPGAGPSHRTEPEAGIAELDSTCKSPNTGSPNSAQDTRKPELQPVKVGGVHRWQGYYLVPRRKKVPDAVSYLLELGGGKGIATRTVINEMAIRILLSPRPHFPDNPVWVWDKIGDFDGYHPETDAVLAIAAVQLLVQHCRVVDGGPR
jgi:hypothetical protein